MLSGGVIGLEGIHTFDGAVVINDRTGAYPRFMVNQISGLHAKPDMAASADQATGRDGELARRAFLSGKTITYAGWTEARDPQTMREGQAALEVALDGTDERQMLVAPHPSYPYDAPSYTYMARCVQLEQDDEQTTSRFHRTLGHRRPFVIALRLGDARLYSTDLLTFTTGTLNPISGLSLPAQLPWTLQAPTVAGGTVIVSNPGNKPVDPIIDMYGPITNPTITNLTTGDKLIFNANGGITLGADDFLRVDMRARTVLLNNQANYRSRLDLVASDWWDPNVNGLGRGDSTLRYSGDVIADPAHATITFNPVLL